MLTFPLSGVLDPLALPTYALQQYCTFNEVMIGCQVKGKIARPQGLQVYCCASF